MKTLKFAQFFETLVKISFFDDFKKEIFEDFANVRGLRFPRDPTWEHPEKQFAWSTLSACQAPGPWKRM